MLQVTPGKLIAKAEEDAEKRRCVTDTRIRRLRRRVDRDRDGVFDFGGPPGDGDSTRGVKPASRVARIKSERVNVPRPMPTIRPAGPLYARTAL